MRQLKDAEPQYRGALEGSERTLGAEHPDTLGCRRNFAALLQRTLHGDQISYAQAWWFIGKSAGPILILQFDIFDTIC